MFFNNLKVVNHFLYERVGSCNRGEIYSVAIVSEKVRCENDRKIETLHFVRFGKSCDFVKKNQNVKNEFSVSLWQIFKERYYFFLN